MDQHIVIASIKETSPCAFQICVTNKLLPKTLRATCGAFEQAEANAAQLARGIVPPSPNTSATTLCYWRMPSDSTR